MQIVKPINLSLMHRDLTLAHEPSLVVTVLIASRISTGEFVNEQKMWRELAASFSGKLFDTGMPKTRAEVLVIGDYCPRWGNDEGEGTVGLKLVRNEGEEPTVLLDKKLAVYQDRRWVKIAGLWVSERSNNREKLPIALNYANAYGGVGYSKNPLGKGFREPSLGYDLLPLPNLAYLDSYQHSPDASMVPAALSQLPFDSEIRMRYMGQIDDEYIRSGSRSFPPNFDMRYFNEAAEDQSIKGYLHGGEEYQLENLSEKAKSLTGKVTTLFGRCFVARSEKPIANRETELQEVPMNLDTLWLMPDADLEIASFRAVIRGVGNGLNDKLPRLKSVLCAFEDRQHIARSYEHYLDQYKKRTDPEISFKYALNSEPLVPFGMKDPIQNLLDDGGAQPQNTKIANMQAYVTEAKTQAYSEIEKTKQDLYSQGILNSAELAKLEKSGESASNESEHVAKLMHLLDKISPGLSKGEPLDLVKMDLSVMAEIREYSEGLANEGKSKALSKIDEQLRLMESYDPNSEMLDKIENLKRLREEVELPPMLPRIDLDAQLHSLEEKIAELSSLPIDAKDADDLKSAFDIDSTRGLIKDAQNQFKETYRMGAHLCLPARSPHKGKEQALLKDLVKKYEQGLSVSHGDYAFIDLSSRDLTGINLSGCYLEYVNFQNATLHGANLEGAILAGANLEGADLSNSNLTKANLGGCNLKGTILSNCDLRGIELGKSTIDSTVFAGSVFESLIITESRISNSVFDEASLEKSTVIQCQIDNCSFRRTKFEKSSFVRSTLTTTIMEYADLRGVNFIESNFVDYSCLGSMQVNVRYVGGCKFTKAQFDKSDLSTASFREARGSEVSFDFADISNADFTRCQFPSVSFRNCIGRGAVFVQSEIRGSSFVNADVMASLMSGADLFDVSFENANMFGVDVGGANFGANNFTGANLDRTLISEWQPD